MSPPFLSLSDSSPLSSKALPSSSSSPSQSPPLSPTASAPSPPSSPPERPKPSSKNALLLYCTTAVLLGSTPLAGKISIQDGGFERTIAAPLRVTVAVVASLIVTCGFALFKENFKLLKLKELKYFVGSGLISGVCFILTYFALSRAPSAMLTFMSGLQPFWLYTIVTIFALKVRKQTSLIGLVVAFVGLFFLTGRSFTNQEIGILPIIALTAMSVLIPCSNLLVSEAKESSKLGGQLVIYGISAIVCWTNWAITGPAKPQELPSTVSILALLYSSIAGSFLGFMLYLETLRRLGPATASSLALAQPPIALMFGYCFEAGTQISGPMFAGLALIFAGVGFNWYKNFKIPVPAEPPNAETEPLPSGSGK